MIKRLALLAALLLAPSLASAQCSGVFTTGTVCGNATGSNNTPRMTPSTSFAPSVANPTGAVGLTAVNGSAATAMRSDAAPPLSSSVQSALTATNNRVLLGTGAFGIGSLAAVNSAILQTNGSGVPSWVTGSLPATVFANPTASLGLTAVNGSATTAMRSDAAPALSQSISPTWTGNHTFNPASGRALAVTTVSGVPSTNQGYNIGQTGSGTVVASTLYNQILISDNVNATGTEAYGQWTALTIGGTAAKGNRSAIVGTTQHTSTASVTTGGDLTGVTGQAAASQTNGGTNTGAGAVGTTYGFSGQGILNSGALNYSVTSGGEFQGTIATGASSQNRWGLSIVGYGNNRGATTDAALQIGASALSYSTGILFSNKNGIAPTPTTGTIIGTDGSTVTSTNFASFPTYTFSGNLFDFGTPLVIAGNGGSVFGGATGGNKGAGTVNATGLYINGSALSTSANLTVGTSVIASGTTTRVLFDNAGVLGEYSISGTGNVCMTTSCSMTTPALGTPTALVGTNITGTASGLTAGTVTTNANLTGPIASSGNATSITSQTGTGTKFVVDTSPTIITPTFTTNATFPLHIGGSGTTGTQLSLQTTSGNGTTDAFAFKGGNNGASTFGLWNVTGLAVGTGSSAGADALLTVNANTVLSSVAPTAGTVLHIIGVDSTSPRILVDAFAASPTLNFRKANGTAASPSAINASGTSIGQFAALGYGATGYGGSRTQINFVSTEAWSDTAQGAKTTFFTTPNTTTTAAQALAIKDSGGVYIGAVGSETDPLIGGLALNGQAFIPNMASDTATADSTVCTATTGGKILKGTGTLGICLGTSSARFKDNIVPMKDGLAGLVALSPKNFRYKKGSGDNGAREQYGFTAEEFYKIFPKLTHLDAKGLPLSVDLVGLIPVLVQGVKELKADNDNMKLEIAELKRKVK